MPSFAITAREIADRIQRPEPTIRGWASNFKQFIPRKKIGRAFKYPEESFDTFLIVADLYEKNKTTPEVMEELEKKYLEKGRPVKQPPKTSALTIRSGSDPYLKAILQMVATQQEFNQLFREELKVMKMHMGLMPKAEGPKVEKEVKPAKVKKKVTRKPKKRVAPKKKATPKRKPVKKKPVKKGSFWQRLTGQ